ncbi:MAG: hypothetical protein AAGF12_01125 [Myxococcota bacterium]
MLGREVFFLLLLFSSAACGARTPLGEPEGPETGVPDADAGRADGSEDANVDRNVPDVAPRDCNLALEVSDHLIGEGPTRFETVSVHSLGPASFAVGAGGEQPILVEANILAGSGLASSLRLSFSPGGSLALGVSRAAQRIAVCPPQSPLLILDSSFMPVSDTPVFGPGCTDGIGSDAGFAFTTGEPGNDASLVTVYAPDGTLNLMPFPGSRADFGPARLGAGADRIFLVNRSPRRLGETEYALVLPDRSPQFQTAGIEQTSDAAFVAPAIEPWPFDPELVAIATQTFRGVAVSLVDLGSGELLRESPPLGFDMGAETTPALVATPNGLVVASLGFGDLDPGGGLVEVALLDEELEPRGEQIVLPTSREFSDVPTIDGAATPAGGSIVVAFSQLNRDNGLQEVRALLLTCR